MGTKNWSDINGWFDFSDLYDHLILNANDGSVLVEVGVWLGRSFSYLASYADRSGKSLRVVGVDHFVGSFNEPSLQSVVDSHGGSIYNQFVLNMNECGLSGKYEVIVSDSVSAASNFADNSVWAVFIDGDHRYENVLADIKAWRTKVSDGGILCGHDINLDSVKKAVTEEFGNSWEQRGTCWFVRMITNKVFHIITPCSRPNNLSTIKTNIESVRKDWKIFWHICFDTNKISEENRNKTKTDLKDDWIYFYTASTDAIPNPGKSQINFVLTHIRLNMFDQGFVYVLDDDNILPPDFFSYHYNENESLIYLLPQHTGDTIRQPIPIMRQIDQAQIIVHSNILDYYYELCYDGDGMMIEKICKKVNFKTLANPITYYNGLNT